LIFQSKELPKFYCELQNELHRAILTYQEFLDKTQRGHTRLEKIIDQIRELQSPPRSSECESAVDALMKNANPYQIDTELQNELR